MLRTAAGGVELDDREREVFEVYQAIVLEGVPGAARHALCALPAAWTDPEFEAWLLGPIVI